MFIRTIIILIFVSGYSFSQISSPQLLSDTVYFPLNVNNKWQYMKTGYTPDGPAYALSESLVEYDTIIGAHTYYKISDELNLHRYSAEEKKLYVFWQDSSYVHIDFNVPNNQTYMSFQNGQFVSVTSESGNNTVFLIPRAYGGYLFISNTGTRVRYSDSIGLTYKRVTVPHLSINYDILAAVIYDSLGNYKIFSNGYQPAFQINPVLNIDSSFFKLDFMVNHPYTRVVPPGSPPWNSSLDFIDSVRMYSFYSKDDSLIYLPTKIPAHPSIYQYSFPVSLDTVLLKDGFIFNYRITATDKCIIPATSAAPDTGYYQCVWSEPTGVDHNFNNQIVYALHQNYPNPFNPSTTIGYSIREYSKVIIQIFDILGNEIQTLIDKEKPAGIYEVNWNAEGLPSGVYFYQVKAGNYMETRKMVLLR